MAREPDWDDLLEARREKRRRAEARLFWIIFGLGCVVTAVGVGLWLGNVTGEFPTMPLAGYMTIAFGGFLCWVSRQTWRNI
jgi:hypothetical protein